MVSAADRAKGPARTSVWLERQGGPGRGAESGQPAGLDRDKIIAATVRLLDAEGAAKFSMRRLAAELNVTAMSVYWYVDTKDDLLELALDAVFGTIPLPRRERGRADWREQLRELATGYRGLLVRHPWVSPLIGHVPQHRPALDGLLDAGAAGHAQHRAAAARPDGRAFGRLPVRVRLRHDRGPLHCSGARRRG